MKFQLKVTITAFICITLILIIVFRDKSDKPIVKYVELPRKQYTPKKPLAFAKPPQVIYKSDITQLEPELKHVDSNSVVSPDGKQTTLSKKFSKQHFHAKKTPKPHNVSASVDYTFVPLFEQRKPLAYSQEFQRHIQQYQILRDGQRLKISESQQKQIKKDMFNKLPVRYQKYFNNIDEMKKEKLKKTVKICQEPYQDQN